MYSKYSKIPASLSGFIILIFLIICTPKLLLGNTIIDSGTISITGTSTSNTCNGLCVGTVDVEVSGGSGVYTYEWDTNPVQTSQDLANLCAGVYTVTVTDDTGCSEVATFFIGEPSLIVIAYSISEPSCNGSCDGNIMPTVTGGAPPYSFQWSNGGNGCDISDLCAGDYTVTVTDVFACTSTASMTVGEPEPISITSSSNGPSCFGICDGSIDIEIEGGTGDFTFLWSNGEISEDLTNLCEEIYTVTVTDENNCTEVLQLNIAGPDGLSIVPNIQNIDCNGECTGAVDIEVSGGTPPYSFEWSDGSNDEDPANLCAGFITVTVTDANACFSSITVDITEPDAIEIDGVSTEATCGICNGTIDLTVTGGTGPYSFDWSGGVSDVEDPTDLCVGFYEVTVTDNNGCTNTYSISVNSPGGITFNPNITEVSCFGICDGSIELNTEGGTPPYTFTWTGQGTGPTENIFDLCAGLYAVTATDSDGCQAVANFIIEQPQGGPNISGNLLFCFDGQSILDAGVGYDSYLWSDGSMTQTISVSESGDYSVTVTNGVNCEYSDTVNVVETEEIIFSVSTIAETDSATNDGTATAEIGLQNIILYSWDDPTGQQTQTAVDLAPGDYCVTVTDISGCTGVSCGTVEQGGCILTGEITSQDVTCFGFNNGSATVNASGSSGAYSYIWSNGSSQSTINNLTPGNYSVTVTENDTCSIILETIIAQPMAGVLAMVTCTQESAPGANDGTCTVQSSGGTGSYTEQWSTGASGIIIIDLAPGNYCVTITDSNGCTAENCGDVAPFGCDIELEVNSTDAICSSGCTGTIDLTVNNGTAPFTYTWNDANIGNIEDPTDLCPGDYTVTVTDGNDCSAIISAIIFQPPLLIVTNTASADATCNGGCDGAATVTVSGGIPPYSYSWDGPYEGPNPNNLCAGAATVSVTDSYGCVVTSTVIISEPTPVSPVVTCTPESGVGANDGSCTVQSNGGTAPYSEIWSNGGTGITIDNLASGTYCVTITDFFGCTGVSCGEVGTVGCDMILETISTDVLCANECNGSIDLTVSNGNDPYTFEWSDPTIGNVEDPVNLCPGEYTVTVTDNIGCTETTTAIITEPSPIIATVTCTAESEIGANDGTCSVSTEGGVPGYTELWSTGETGIIITDLEPGTYCVTITDSQGCTAVSCGNVAPAGCEINLEILSNTTTCFSECEGSIDLQVNNGAMPFTYEWEQAGIGNIEDPTGLCPGNYSVTVTDANLCSATISASILENSEILANLVYTGPPCEEACTGTVDATVTGGTEPYTYSWNNGETTEDVFNLCFDESMMVTVTDALGCTGVFIPTVFIVPSPMSVFSTVTEPSCFGDCDASISIEIIDGVEPYDYDWSNDDYDGMSEISDLCPMEYLLTITDAIGCSTVFLEIIEEPFELLISSSTTDACFQECDGTAVIVATGGTGPYTYQWTNGQEDLCPGNYEVTVTDANGCSAIEEFTIEENPEIFYSIDNVTNEMDTAGNGAIEITVSGGSMPFEFDWKNNGVSTSTDEDPNDLPAGTYVCEITDANGCVIITEEVIVDDIVNVLETEWANQIKVFPNPVQDLLYIDFNLNDPLEVSLEIFDIRGVRVYKQSASTNNYENEVLDLSQLTTGVYTLRISSEDSFYTFKIIKLIE